MGIESDQVVYEYLSRVGDVAQQRQLPSSTRMRLVSELRNEIDRSRAKDPVDTPAAVRRIIARLGSPHEVVDAAGSGAGGPATGGAPRTPAPPPAGVAVPVQRDAESEVTGRPKRLWKGVPRPRPAQPSPTPAPSDHASSSPHLAGLEELGDSAAQPDWWRVDSSPFGVGDSVAGFVGGVEIPELFTPPPPKPKEVPGPEQEAAVPPAPAVPAVEKAATKFRKAWWKPRKGDAKAGATAPAAKAGDAVVDAPVSTRRRLLPLRGTAGGWSNPLLLLAAGLLVAGAVLGNWIALVLGWAIAYASRRLTDAETKWAVVILPGLSVTAGAVWLWGRTEGRWGRPIAQDHMNAAISETWPWVVRGAAVASALFLVWRSQRRR
ncbi:hypothetical protein M2271_006724 [Streptomyces sp. LBL]|uniref:hypothetical protein n=1 Tax=Streptomyces sp. LBL TaxID=2940562 RepID=UPI002474A8A7|nr:hypothetical protein [Streptomyces sp. LBL]MDH6628889.1 hypothetical protein [Streptomyces sp. LBL]